VLFRSEEFYAGYAVNPADVLAKTFEEVADYDEIVLLKNMAFESHCEHHMVPIIGVAHIAYLPDKKVVGISKIARLLDVFAKRLQTQELMTKQIADAIEDALQPKGIAVIIDAKHECMTTRGVHKADTSTVTSQMRGRFRSDPKSRAEVLQLIATPKL
jgi:GTP cyclohydrolase I